MRRRRAEDLRVEALHLQRKAADIREQGSLIIEKSRQLKKDSQQRINARSIAGRKNKVNSRDERD